MPKLDTEWHLTYCEETATCIMDIPQELVSDQIRKPYIPICIKKMLLLGNSEWELHWALLSCRGTFSSAYHSSNKLMVQASHTPPRCGGRSLLFGELCKYGFDLSGTFTLETNKQTDWGDSFGLREYFIKIKLTKDYSWDVLELTNLPINLTLPLSKWVTIRIKTLDENWVSK